MPAATTREELIEVTEKDWIKLTSAIDKVSEALALTKYDDVSIKDILGHRAHWIGLYLGWYLDGTAGREVSFPAKGYKWNQLGEYNAVLRRAQAGLSWVEAKALLVERHGDLLEFIGAHNDPELYGGPMKGAYNQWTPGRWAEASGASHYRSATKFTRKCLREAGLS